MGIFRPILPLLSGLFLFAFLSLGGCSTDTLVGPTESLVEQGQGGDGHNNVGSDGDGHNNVESDGDGHNNVVNGGDGHNNKS